MYQKLQQAEAGEQRGCQEVWAGSWPPHETERSEGRGSPEARDGRQSGSQTNVCEINVRVNAVSEEKNDVRK